MMLGLMLLELLDHTLINKGEKIDGISYTNKSI